MTEHVIESLSELIDGRLAEDRRAAVESHLSACPACASELEDLKAVSASLKALPREPLPVGFMQRLERRRLEGEAPKRDYVFLPFPARVAAFALSSFIVGFMVFENFRVKKPSTEVERFMAAQGDLASSGIVSKLDSPAAPAPAAAPAAVALDATEEDAAPSRARAKAKGSSFGYMAKANTVGAVRGAASDRYDGGALPIAGRSFGGAPIGEKAPEPPKYTNEQLQAGLEAEKKEMGIRRVMSLDEVRSQKRAEAEAQFLEAGGIASVAGAGAGGGAMMGPAPKMAAIEGSTPDLGYASTRKTRQAVAVPAPFQGAVASDEASALAAWRDAGLPGRPPAFDAEKSMLVIVPGAVIDARESAGQIVVRYRPGEAPARQRWALIPRSPLPVAFEPKL